MDKFEWKIITVTAIIVVAIFNVEMFIMGMYSARCDNAKRVCEESRISNEVYFTLLNASPKEDCSRYIETIEQERNLTDLFYHEYISEIEAHSACEASAWEEEDNFFHMTTSGIGHTESNDGSNLQIKFSQPIQIVSNSNLAHISCTGSMKPTLNCNNTLIITNSFEKSDIRVGDIVYYKTELDLSETYPDVDYVVHRVISIEGDNYTIRGDVGGMEEVVPYLNIRYKVVGIIY